MDQQTCTVAGVSLRRDHDMVVRAQAERGGVFEPEALAIWTELARKGGTFLDVGAYTGLYAIAAKRAGATRSVAVEPNAAACARIVHNADLNGVAIDVYCAAAWHECGRVMLSGRGALSSAANVLGRGLSIGMVDALTIDSLGLDDVCAIKIDVERAERAVLAGALATIRKSRPALLVEELPDADLTAIVGMLEPMAYLRTPLSQNMVEWRSGW